MQGGMHVVLRYSWCSGRYLRKVRLACGSAASRLSAYMKHQRSAESVSGSSAQHALPQTPAGRLGSIVVTSITFFTVSLPSDLLTVLGAQLRFLLPDLPEYCSPHCLWCYWSRSDNLSSLEGADQSRERQFCPPARYNCISGVLSAIRRMDTRGGFEEVTYLQAFELSNLLRDFPRISSVLLSCRRLTFVSGFCIARCDSKRPHLERAT